MRWSIFFNILSIYQFFRRCVKSLSKSAAFRWLKQFSDIWQSLDKPKNQGGTGEIFFFQFQTFVICI